jgi:hypothetical protein
MEAPACTIDQPLHGAYEKFIEMTTHLSAMSKGDEPHRASAASLETDGRELLRLLLQEPLDNPGCGRVAAVVRGSDGVVHSHTRAHLETGSKSVFGAVRVARTGESQGGVSSLVPRAAPWNLPAQGSAPRWPKRVAAKAAKRSWASVAGAIATATGGRLGQRQVEQIVSAAAQDVDAFYAQPCPEEVQRQAAATPLQGLTFDGKGVVLRQEALRKETRKRAEAHGPTAPRGLPRQDQANRQRMATGAGRYPIDRHVRRPPTVAQQFAPLRLGPHNRRVAPKPVGKQLWARLDKSMQTVMATGLAEGQRRAPMHQAAWGVWVDGDLTPRADSEPTARALGVRVVLLVAIMHVLEYLGKAAQAWLPPDAPQGAQGVGDQTLQRLQGEVQAIVRHVRRGATAKGMSATQREPIEQCATSWANHAAYLNSPDSLAKGSPIATGVSEGACRHLVKERMEITGARWGLEGGEAVRTLRALVIKGDFDAYWDFHEQQEYQRNHRTKCSEMPTARPTLQLIAGGKD